MHRVHRTIGIAAKTACAATMLSIMAATAMAGTLGGPLELEDDGSFFVGGTPMNTGFPGAPAAGGAATPGQIIVNQMYVHYRIPKTSNAIAVVMVHGSGHTGATFETTPDSREGWATYFLRKNFPVYVVDHSGRGRSGFDPTPVNRAKVEGNASLLPDFPIATRERAWSFFRLGATFPTPYPGTQFPMEALDQYFAQLVPNAENSLAGGGENTVKGLAALLDRIGPAVVLVHSQSGAYGLDLIRARPSLVRAFVNVEGNCAPVAANEIASSFGKVPFLAVWGDNSVGAPGPNGNARRDGCASTISAIKQAGGAATFLLLPDQGIKGNTHMMMLDKNNLVVADKIIEWINTSVARN
jgi:pimeloyl-ACP methyl ester carboxylesterase